MMISDTPLPMPRLVICSPIHIRNMVPPTRLTVPAISNSMPGCDDRLMPWLTRLRFEPAHREIALDQRDHDGQVAGILVEPLAPGLALFLERLPRAVERGAELNHDRGGDVGHDAQRDDARSADSAPPEKVLKTSRMPPLCVW